MLKGLASTANRRLARDGANLGISLASWQPKMSLGAMRSSVELSRSIRSSRVSSTRNTLRKDFTPSERVAIVESLRGYAHGGDRKSDQGRKCDVDRLTTKDAAGRVGFCRDDYFRAKKVVSQGIPELVDAMDSGKLSISAASELAGSHPDTQRRVLATVKDENGWAVRGMRKSLNRAKRRMAIDVTEGRKVQPPGEGDIKIYHCPFQPARRGRWDQAEFGQPCADRHSRPPTRILAPSRRACGVRRQGSGKGGSDPKKR